MKIRNKLILGVASLGLCLSAQANERLFTYSYEPETLPQGAMEFEQWVTLRAGRTAKVGQKNYNRWELREELEYGVTDNYTVSLYLNTQAESFRDPATLSDESEFEFKGISIENRLMIVNPADHKIGVTLYLEPSYSGEEAGLEQKILIGQRVGQYKWAANLSHETEWEHNFDEVEGELEFTFGISRELSKHFWLGVELRDKNELPEYEEWENTAVYFGPAFHYRQEKWWATLTVLPQIYGKNFNSDVDGNGRLELEGNEKVNIRIIAGFSF